MTTRITWAACMALCLLAVPARSQDAVSLRSTIEAHEAATPGTENGSTGTLPRRYWQDMTTTEFASLDADRVIAVLPIASIEQHGPHLPVCADACTNQAVIERTLELLPDELPVTVLPMMPVGKANEHSSFPGTLTLESETVQRLWTEIAESVHRVGIRKLVLFNSHGGNRRILQVVARDLRVRLDMLVVVAGPTYWTCSGKKSMSTS